MPCRNDSSDSRKCDRCGAFLWVAEEALFCGECGVTMPCSMRLLPATPTGVPVVQMG
ncbi:MAG: hypothetical protein L3K13_07530 [Thermoplasmata archaeon]|nr:hypothetical protein [Thermoplasmata archaeon]